MRKNGSRLISLRQYRLTDLFIFAVILVAFDLLACYAPKLVPQGAYFTFTLTVPITLLVMMRWNWISVFFAIGDGILLSLLNHINVWQSYLSYSAGNCFMMFLLLLTKFVGKEKIAGRWYFTALFVILAWVLMNFGITAVEAICGFGFVECLKVNFGLGINGLMSLALALIVILVMRKLDGMFEDQKHYLLRLDKERKEKMKRDEFGDEPIEIDAESLAVLNKQDDELFK